MTLHYIEFVSVQRHILQVDAEGEEDCLEKALDHARGEWVDGLNISDDAKPVLLHEPFNNVNGSFGEMEDDQPMWFANNPFGDDQTQWMRDAAKRLTFLADKADAEKEATDVDPA